MNAVTAASTETTPTKVTRFANSADVIRWGERIAQREIPLNCKTASRMVARHERIRPDTSTEMITKEKVTGPPVVANGQPASALKDTASSAAQGWYFVRDRP